MNAYQRFTIRSGVTVAVLGGFLLGVSQLPSAAIAPRLGVAFGLGSAICWGFTAADDDDEGFPWNGFFNACAALCAAIAVGFLIPKEACQPAPTNLFPRLVCSLYPQHSLAPAVPANSSRKTGDEPGD